MAETVAHAPDPTLVALLDEALARADVLRSVYSNAGQSKRIEMLDRMIRFLSTRRNDAAKGALHDPSEAPLGISRAVGDYEWGSEGDGFVDAAYEVERHWRTRR